MEDLNELRKIAMLYPNDRTVNGETLLALLNRLEQAEQAVERVHTLTNELSWFANHVAIVQRYRDALDGDGRG